MKFRAPSPSVDSIASGPAQSTHAQARRSPTAQAEPVDRIASTQATKPKKPHVTSRRVRAHKLDKAKAAVKDAAKRAKRTKQLVEPCVAYVGNIGPDVDEELLIAHFSRYGKILSARIHCCGGVAMTVKPPPASYHQNMRVRQYAMLIFESKSARHRACKLENILKGRKLVVSVAVSDLPEVKEKVVKRLDDYRSRLEPPDLRRAQKSALKSLKLEPTILLDSRYENKRRKVHNRRGVMGLDLTFREGIM